MKKNKYESIYFDIYDHLWEMTCGQGGSQTTIYKGVRLFSQFLNSEIDRHGEVEKSGESSIERRGLASPPSMMRVWAFEMMAECHGHRIVPPWELCEAIYRLMGCSHKDGPKGKFEPQKQFHVLMKEDPNMSIRAASKMVGVDKRTGARWLKKGPRSGNELPYMDGFPEWPEYYSEISGLTNFREFMLMPYRPSYCEKMKKRKEESGAFESN